MVSNDEFKVIDIFKLFFACMIPLLHIEFADNRYIFWIKQIISRLGVPFFFMTSGFFFGRMIEKKGVKNALRKYEKRVIFMLFFWLMVYFYPLVHSNLLFKKNMMKMIFFQTPAYLWYLSALAFAAVLISIIRKDKLKMVLSIILYIVGTLGSDSYIGWLVPKLDIIDKYNRLFLTTVNGLFFGFPFMYMGEKMWYIMRSRSNEGIQNTVKVSKVLQYFVFLFLLYIIEVCVVQHKVWSKRADTSMYFMLMPLVTLLFLLILLLEKKIGFVFIFDTKLIRTWSSAIYCMQYGVIAVIYRISKLCKLREFVFLDFLVYFCVLIVPIITIKIFESSYFFQKVIKKIF